MKKRLFVTKFITLLCMLALIITTTISVPALALADETDIEEEEEEEEYEEEDEEEYDDMVHNFCAVKISKNSVTLKWDKVEDVDGYEITYKATSASKWKVKDVSASKTTIKISGLKVKTKYNFRIRSYVIYEEDDEEDEEDDEEYDDEEFDEEDEDDEEDEEDDEDWEDEFYSDYSKMTLRTLDKKGNGDGQAVSDTFASAKKAVKPTKFKSIKSKKKGVAELSWVKCSDASGYEISVSEKAKKGFKKIETVKKASKTSCQIKKLKSGKTYYFKIKVFVKKSGITINSKDSSAVKVKIK